MRSSKLSDPISLENECENNGVFRDIDVELHQEEVNRSQKIEVEIENDLKISGNSFPLSISISCL